MFYISVFGSIHYRVQRTPGGSWGDEETVGGQAKSLAVARLPDGRAELFYTGADDAIRHNWQEPGGGWHGEEGLDGWAKSLAVGQMEDGRLELFHIHMDDKIGHQWQEAGGFWHPETTLLEGHAREIATCRNRAGRLELFYINADFSLHFLRQTQNYDWESVRQGVEEGGSPPPTGRGQQVAVAQNADGRLEVFYVGTDDGIWHNWQTASTSGQAIEGPYQWHGEERFEASARRISVAQNADGRLELFFTDMDGRIGNIWQIEPNGIWSPPHDMGGRATDIAVGRNGVGRLELFHISPEGSIWHTWQVRPNDIWHGEAEGSAVFQSISSPTHDGSHSQEARADSRY